MQEAGYVYSLHGHLMDPLGWNRMESDMSDSMGCPPLRSHTIIYFYHFAKCVRDKYNKKCKQSVVQWEQKICWKLSKMNGIRLCLSTPLCLSTLKNQAMGRRLKLLRLVWFNPLYCFFGSEGHVALDRNPGTGYDTLLLRMIPGDLLSAFPHRQFHTLPGLLDSWAALPNSNPNACMPMQGGSLYYFYDGLWYDPAERRTHDLACERRTRYRLSQHDTVSYRT